MSISCQKLGPIFHISVSGVRVKKPPGCFRTRIPRIRSSRCAYAMPASLKSEAPQADAPMRRFPTGSLALRADHGLAFCAWRAETPLPGGAP